MRRDILGAFRLTPNGNGLPYEILVNEVWADRPLYELSETMLHEQLHMCRVEVTKEDPRGNYHSKGFVRDAEQMGLHPKLNKGYHLRPADGQFQGLMERLGIDKPEYAKSLPTDGSGGIILPPGVKNWFDIDRGRKTGGRIKGESTLKKWSCECEPPQSVRVGKSRLAAICLDCGSTFKLQP